MKTYTKVQMVAKNAPMGSYAAGCPAENSDEGGSVWNPFASRPGEHPERCKACERTV